MVPMCLAFSKWSTWLCLKTPKSLLDTVSTGSGSDLISNQYAIFPQGFETRFVDQVATAPCTDCVQSRNLTFEARPVHVNSIVSSNLDQMLIRIIQVNSRRRSAGASFKSGAKIVTDGMKRIAIWDPLRFDSREYAIKVFA